ncbi:two-component regulator propeller domain-containing protein [Mucilaginibacter sp.]|uniref:ligand-binding sensor domain-containing protein n=1 Tax=Mucilaginibacter sp. TaxID=1882438 RepID=UPI003565539A
MSLVSLMWLLAVSSSYAQYYFKHYQVDDGLIHNSVTCVIQDSKGLIWIGTRGGLNRFDGYTFKTFKNKNNKFGNIGNNIITALAEDKNGMLWIGTGKGIFKYDPYKEVFTALEIAPQTYISHLLIDSKNKLWFAANFSLYKYNQADKKIENLKIQVTCMVIDRSKNLWVGNNDGVISIYNPQGKSIASVRIIDQGIPASLRSISKIFPVNENEVLVGCFKQGLKSYNIKTGIIKTLSLRNNDNTDVYVRDITAGNDQEYWIATESGIYIYNLSTNTSQHLRKLAGDPYSIAGNAVYTIFKDNRGDMWAGTFFGGLNYYSKENAQFEKYYPLSGSNSISGDAVREICSDNKGNLWIGTEDAGINKLNLKTKRFTNYTATGKKGDVSYPNIHGLLALGNQLFIGPFFHGMEIMDIRTGLITERFKLIGDKKDKVSDFVLCIYLTRDSTLLIGTAYGGSGLFKYNRKLKTFSRIQQIPYNSYVFAIKEDVKGNIWTGSVDQGAFYYNPKTGQHGNIRFGDTVKNKIINEFAVRGILEDSNHFMWFATEGGLIKLDPDLKTVKKFTTEHGLPTNTVYSILEDDSKHLWISSLKGLICLDLRTEQFKTYTRSNGLITDQFNYNSAYKDVNGKMYFGSFKGMIAFNPAEFDQKDSCPPTYITGFQVNAKEIVPNDKEGPLTKSILYTDTIVMTHDQNNFSIEFAALNYSSPKVTRYKYLMKGLDKDWTYLNSNRNAYFTGLAAGNYTFIVRAESNIGSWTGKERRLFIKILPPFWKSYTAYFLYLLVSSIGLFLSIRYYHRHLERKNLIKLQLFEHEKKREIYEAKIEFFTNIAHEIKTPLTLIAGPVEWLIEKAKGPDVKRSLLIVDKNAKRLTELTSQLLDFRKTEMNQFGLNFVNTNITNLLMGQIANFNQEAKKCNISLNTDMPDAQLIAFVDRDALVKICGNLISNAIKYAASEVTVSIKAFNISDKNFSIRFINDGKGIPAEFSEQIFEPFFRLHGDNKAGTGIGLSLAKSLTELHNGSLSLVSGNTNMIIFELTLPVHQKFEFELGSWKKID